MQLGTLYHTAQESLAFSGFGWDDAMQIITANDDVWDCLVIIRAPTIAFAQVRLAHEGGHIRVLSFSDAQFMRLLMRAHGSDFRARPVDYNDEPREIYGNGMVYGRHSRRTVNASPAQNGQ